MDLHWLPLADCSTVHKARISFDFHHHSASNLAHVQATDLTNIRPHIHDAIVAGRLGYIHLFDCESLRGERSKVVQDRCCSLILRFCSAGGGHLQSFAMRYSRKPGNDIRSAPNITCVVLSMPLIVNMPCTVLYSFGNWEAAKWSTDWSIWLVSAFGGLTYGLFLASLASSNRKELRFWISVAFLNQFPILWLLILRRFFSANHEKQCCSSTFIWILPT